MKITKRQLQRIIREEIYPQNNRPLLREFEEIESEIIGLAGGLHKGSMSMSEDELEFAVANLIDSALYEVARMMKPHLQEFGSVDFHSALLRAIQDDDLQSWRHI